LGCGKLSKSRGQRTYMENIPE